MSVNERERANRRGTANKSRISCGLKIAGVIVAAVVIIVAAILATPYVARFGFCQGWWLRQVPLAHYWWYCDCGPEFERRLYPDDVEIVVSACRDPHRVTLSPDGRYMIVALGPKYDNFSLLDLATSQEKPWSYPILSGYKVGFWTDTLVLIKEGHSSWKLVDVVDGSVIDLTTFEASQENTILQVPADALQAFRETDRALIRAGGRIALALAADPKQHPDRNYVLFYPQDNPRDKYTEQLETIYLEEGIDYEYSNPCWINQLEPCPSHNGRFLATNTSILLPDKQLLVGVPDVQTFRSGVGRLGWAHDDSGVYLQFGSGHVIRGYGIGVIPGMGRIPQPIVKLNVPEEYLPATPTPVP